MITNLRNARFLYEVQHHQLRLGSNPCASFAARPEVDLEGLQASATSTLLWQNGNRGTNELDLQRALACPGNEHVLVTLAGASAGSHLEWAAREVGDAGGVDLTALIAEPNGGKVLLLVDVKNGRATTRSDMLTRLTQGCRLVRNTLDAVVVRGGASRIAWVLLGGKPSASVAHVDLVRAGVLTDSGPEKGCLPQWWSLSTFVAGDSDRREYVLVAPKESLWFKLGSPRIPERVTEYNFHADRPDGLSLQSTSHPGTALLRIRLKKLAHLNLLKALTLPESRVPS
jgi:hypothetical protein